MSGARPDEPATDHDTLIGRVIAGKFVIARLLGAGAMGAVYQAEQTALERSVAIKVMRGGFAADATYAARFHLEAKAASRLDHPNLIRVLDYGQEADGLLYIAMEYLDCRDLFTVLAEDWPLTHERIVDILSQTLSGLADAHEAGVLHRDLKPENIMIVRRKGDEGRPVDLVKVGDFGIAKLVEPVGSAETATRADGRKLTTAGLVVGTPEYMSPEQARGESFDARSDLYAIGVVLYQLLTRRLPFQGKTSIEVVFKAMHEEPAKLGSDGLTAAPGLDPICVKAMSRRPEDRFQDAREMRAALRAAPVLAAHVVIGSEANAGMSQAPTQAELAVPGGVWRRAVAIGAVALVATVIFVARRVPHDAPAPSLAVSEPSAVQATTAHEEHAPSVVASASAPVPPPSSAASIAAPPSQPASYRSPRNARQPAPASPDLSVDARVPAPAPVPVAPQPPPAIAPVTATASAEIPNPPRPQPPAPSFNLETARVEIGQVKTNNAAAASGSVSRALGPLAARFTACFRSALAQNGGANGGASGVAMSDGIANLHLESDDEGYVTVAHVSGAAPPSAARCIEGLSHNVHIQVDTGTANADVTLTFEPL